MNKQILKFSSKSRNSLFERNFFLFLILETENDSHMIDKSKPFYTKVNLDSVALS